MLRASSKTLGREVRLRGILSPGEGTVGVDHEQLLLAFADAVNGADAMALGTARSALLQELGPAALVDAAAVAGNFERMNRIADACGIALGRLVTMATEVRRELAIEYFNSARNADGVV